MSALREGVMEYREWRFRDDPDFRQAEDWGPGPWDNEPDKVQWQDEATGLPCLARRGPMGSWCGYVGVPKDHPLYGVNYDQCPQDCVAEPLDPDGLPPGLREAGRRIVESPHYRPSPHCDHTPESLFEVHGGITFSGGCDDSSPERGICHIAPGEDDVWWFGFDCCHAGDLAPGLEATNRRLGFTHNVMGDVYKPLGYVKDECAHLAKQLV